MNRNLPVVKLRMQKYESCSYFVTFKSLYFKLNIQIYHKFGWRNMKSTRKNDISNHWYIYIVLLTCNTIHFTSKYKNQIDNNNTILTYYHYSINLSMLTKSYIYLFNIKCHSNLKAIKVIAVKNKSRVHHIIKIITENQTYNTYNTIYIKTLE